MATIRHEKPSGKSSSSAPQAPETYPIPDIREGIALVRLALDDLWSFAVDGRRSRASAQTRKGINQRALLAHQRLIALEIDIERLCRSK